MGVSSSEPSQQSSPCTDSSFLLVLLPPLLLSCLMLAMPDMQALLPLTHTLPMELPQLPMLVLPMLPQLLHLLPLLLPMPVLDFQKPVLMLFPSETGCRGSHRRADC